MRVPPQTLSELLHPVFDEREKAAALAAGRLLATGLPAAPGAAVGQVVFDADRAVEWAKSGQHVILVRPGTSPEDVAGMYAAQGIVTARGGRTSHAAVVAVGMGKPCVVGASDVVVDEERRAFEARGRIIREGEVVSVDGATGEVILDDVPTIGGELPEEVRTYLAWADRYRMPGGLGVRANADTPEDARKAREFGAEGIGLVRTEPMLGHRGCRLGITSPEIYGMQVRAIMEAACTVAEQGVKVEPEIMIPLTGTVGEMKLTYDNTKKVADGVLAEMGVPVKYAIGTM